VGFLGNITTTTATILIILGMGTILSLLAQVVTSSSAGLELIPLVAQMGII
jgi:hypothetical protein